ncbi:MAG TPA: hypothetical protein VIE67_12305 [Rudaea sp.]|jgi:uncharacterized membrane protein YjjB (DUF3815 family)|uniref:hypothetical protein n=1 Tax=Rudaea sp. TaxID=2136325 RepID=UPI002F944D11
MAERESEPQLPEHLRPGVTLSAADIDDLRAAIARHDQHIQQLEQSLTELNRRLQQPSPAAQLFRPVMRLADRVAQHLKGPLRFARKLVARVATAIEHPAWFCLVALIIQLPLVFNLGYFNHDELQWLSFADQPSLSQIPWNAWFDFQPFQYRPLTFNLWLLLSYYLGYHAIAMHLLRVLCGIGVALLLRATLLRFDVPARRASVATLVFLLLPEVVYTHAWIGTYADSLSIAFALCAILWTLRESAPAATAAQAIRVGLPIAALTGLALLSKESSVVVPALLLVAAIRRRDRTLVVAIFSSALVVAAYLYLRLDTILFAPRNEGAYVWSVANIPDRLSEYAIFPFLIGRFDAMGAYADQHVVFALVCLGIFLLAVSRAGWRFIAALCLGWVAALGPTLILSYSANHYAYVSAAFACGLVAIAWSRLHKPARLTIAVLAVIACTHGYEEAKEMRRIGRVQHHLYEGLTRILDHSTAPVRIKAAREKEDFILRRVLHEIPSYKRIPFGDRVVVIPYSDNSITPTYVMAGNGRLSAVSP